LFDEILKFNFLLAGDCLVYGDPHYTTFDNKYYTYMGKCVYTLVTYRDSSRLHVYRYSKVYRRFMLTSTYQVKIKSFVYYSDNTVCDEATNATCLKRVFVKWEETLVELYHNQSLTLAQSVRWPFPIWDYAKSSTDVVKYTLSILNGYATWSEFYCRFQNWVCVCWYAIDFLL